MKWFNKFLDWFDGRPRTESMLVDSLNYSIIRDLAEGEFGEEVANLMTDTDLIEWYNCIDRLKVLKLK